MADVILQFKRTRKYQSSITADVDVKATSNDIPNSGKSPNITSFARIRTAYCKDPDTKMMMGIMEVVDFNAYDLKYISQADVSYNPALGSGQLQLRDVHYVARQNRTVWEFCQMIDKKCIASRTGFNGWYRYAKRFEWIKNE